MKTMMTGTAVDAVSVRVASIFAGWVQSVSGTHTGKWLRSATGLC